MSRVNLLEKLYNKPKSIFDFNYNDLKAPLIYQILTPTDTGDLCYIAKSLKYAANVSKKYKLIDQIMKRRAFKKAHSGTNRVVYNFLDLQTFVAKIAIDRVGIKDNPMEYKNQELLKPFCCKIFEHDPTGVISFVERVNPVSSLEEFQSIEEDVFNLMMYLVVDRGLILDDVGSEYYMNYGVRYLSNGIAFGPVITDFPWVAKIDGNKLICTREMHTPLGLKVCGGEIDYSGSLSHIRCCKCGKTYTAMDLAKPDCTIKMFGADGEELKMARAKVINRKTREVLIDTGRSSDTIIDNDKFNEIYNKIYKATDSAVKVDKVIYPKRRTLDEKKKDKATRIINGYNAVDDLDKPRKVSITTPLTKSDITVVKENFNTKEVEVKEVVEETTVCDEPAIVLSDKEVKSLVTSINNLDSSPSVYTMTEIAKDEVVECDTAEELEEAIEDAIEEYEESKDDESQEIAETDTIDDNEDDNQESIEDYEVEEMTEETTEEIFNSQEDNVTSDIAEAILNAVINIDKRNAEEGQQDDDEDTQEEPQEAQEDDSINEEEFRELESRAVPEMEYQKDDSDDILNEY